jgi:hypothetical protein
MEYTAFVKFTQRHWIQWGQEFHDYDLQVHQMLPKKSISLHNLANLNPSILWRRTAMQYDSSWYKKYHIAHK